MYNSDRALTLKRNGLTDLRLTSLLTNCLGYITTGKKDEVGKPGIKFGNAAWSL